MSGMFQTLPREFRCSTFKTNQAGWDTNKQAGWDMNKEAGWDMNNQAGWDTNIQTGLGINKQGDWVNRHVQNVQQAHDLPREYRNITDWEEITAFNGEPHFRERRGVSCEPPCTSVPPRERRPPRPLILRSISFSGPPPTNHSQHLFRLEPSYRSTNGNPLGQISSEEAFESAPRNRIRPFENHLKKSSSFQNIKGSLNQNLNRSQNQNLKGFQNRDFLPRNGFSDPWEPRAVATGFKNFEGESMVPLPLQTAEYTTSQQSRPDIHQPINQFNIGENKQLNSTVPVQYNSLINDEARNPPEFSESSQNLPENPPMIKPELKPRVRRKPVLWKSKSLANLGLPNNEDYKQEREKDDPQRTDLRASMSRSDLRSDQRASISRTRSGSWRNLLALQQSKLSCHGPPGLVQGPPSVVQVPPKGQIRGLKPVEPPIVPLRKKLRSLSSSFPQSITVASVETGGNEWLGEERIEMSNFNYPPHSGCPTSTFQTGLGQGQYYSTFQSSSFQQDTGTRTTFTADGGHGFSSPFRGQQGGFDPQIRRKSGVGGGGVGGEDQGIDMTLSPGRDSPGHESTASSAASTTTSRNSTTSIDSGRASNSTMEPRPPLHLGHAHRLSNVSSQSGGDSISSSRQSHHSSNSSLGDRFEDSICTLNIQDMLNAGIPDEEILTAWLTDLHFEEYYQLFTSAGYDMPTISRMTPEDLTAVGIKKPNHRKKLKAEIGRLNISDGLPDFLPDCLEDWLGLLRLDEYGPNLRSQGYNTILDVTTISIEDLEDTGFYRLGHQKRLLLAIRRAKELLGGKRVQPTTFQTQDTGISKLPPRPSLSSFTHQVHDIQPFHHNQQHSPHLHQQHSFQQQQQPFHSFQQFNPSQSQHNPSQSQHNPSQSQHNQSQCLFQPTSGHQQHTPLQYLPDFMRIKQSGGFASNEELPTSIPDPMPPLQYPLYQTTFQGGTIPHQGGANFQGGYPGSPRFIPRAAGGLGHPPSPSPWRMMRSYDDADILRHADHSVLIHDAPRSQNKSGTLPRPKGTIKPRPVAKIIAKTRESEPEIEVSKEDHGKDLKAGGCDTEDSPGTSSGMSSPNRLQGSPTPTLRRPRRGSDTGIQMRKIGSFESDPGTIPFANDNAGTIRIRSNSQVTLPERPERHRDGATTPKRVPGRTAGDVLNDIGSMLADLTDELDAMLQLERDTQ